MLTKRDRIYGSGCFRRFGSAISLLLSLPSGSEHESDAPAERVTSPMKEEDDDELSFDGSRPRSGKICYLATRSSLTCQHALIGFGERLPEGVHQKQLERLAARSLVRGLSFLLQEVGTI